MALPQKSVQKEFVSAQLNHCSSPLPNSCGSLYPIPTAQAVGRQPSCQPWRAWLLPQRNWEVVLSCHYLCFMGALQVLLVQITFSVYVLCMKQTLWGFGAQSSCVKLGVSWSLWRPTMVTVFHDRLTALFSAVNWRQVIEVGTISAVLALSFTLCFALHCICCNKSYRH